MHVDATVDDGNTFIFESPDLFLSPGATRGQCNLAVSLEYAMPRQAAAIGRLGQGATDTSRAAVQARKLCHLSITGNVPCGDSFDDIPDTPKRTG
jgi:hypothetical protein